MKEEEEENEKRGGDEKENRGREERVEDKKCNKLVGGIFPYR